jgi:hypothetical protein
MEPGLATRRASEQALRAAGGHKFFVDDVSITAVDVLTIVRLVTFDAAMPRLADVRDVGLIIALRSGPNRRRCGFAAHGWDLVDLYDGRTVQPSYDLGVDGVHEEHAVIDEGHVPSEFAALVGVNLLDAAIVVRDLEAHYGRDLLAGESISTQVHGVITRRGEHTGSGPPP